MEAGEWAELSPAFTALSLPLGPGLVKALPLLRSPARPATTSARVTSRWILAGTLDSGLVWHPQGTHKGLGWDRQETRFLGPCLELYPSSRPSRLVDQEDLLRDPMPPRFGTPCVPCFAIVRGMWTIVCYPVDRIWR